MLSSNDYDSHLAALFFFGKWPSQMFLASLLQTSIQTFVDRFLDLNLLFIFKKF